jgi:hypothetical protein
VEAGEEGGYLRYKYQENHIRKVCRNIGIAALFDISSAGAQYIVAT